MHSPSQLLRQATANTGSLISLQLFSRATSFLLNAAVIRWTTPAVVGIATVKLELFYNTIVLLSRDGLRVSMMRYGQKGEDELVWTRKLFHMCWLVLPISVGLLAVFGVLFTVWSVPGEIRDAGLTIELTMAIGVYGACAVLELFLERCDGARAGSTPPCCAENE
jgi:hypothetical protein